MRDDTVHLLEECSAGVRLTKDSLEEILPSVRDKQLQQRIYQSIDNHKELEREADRLLQKMGASAKTPGLLVTGLSRLRTSVQMALNSSCASAASLLTDGCNNSIKLLTRYKNQFPGADATARQLADEIIRTEQGLADELKTFL